MLKYVADAESYHSGHYWKLLNVAVEPNVSLIIGESWLFGSLNECWVLPGEEHLNPSSNCWVMDVGDLSQWAGFLLCSVRN